MKQDIIDQETAIGEPYLARRIKQRLINLYNYQKRFTHKIPDTPATYTKLPWYEDLSDLATCCLGQLNEREKALIVGKVFEDEKLSTLSHRVGIKEVLARKIYRQAKQKLKKCLKSD